MSERAHIGLDNPALSGRLRQNLRPNQPQLPPRYFPHGTPVARSKQATTTTIASLQKVAGRHQNAQELRPIWQQITPVVRQQAAPAPAHQPEASQVLHRQAFGNVAENTTEPKSKPRFSIRKWARNYTKLQFSLMIMAVVVLVVGLGGSLMTFKTNQLTSNKVAALANTVRNPGANDDNAPPSTVKPSTSAVGNYVVGPTMPRYLNIPKLGVHARVLSLGITKSGALATPNNVFDTGWYNESSLPGQPGAMLIDGHVSSWTAHGVFYGLKNLQPGDEIQVERGDGTTFNYQVVKSQTYDSSSVDMNAAVNPVTPGKPGLNLITCTGQVKPGTSEFNQRIIVFASQV